jgi:hypothetical protein
MQSEHVLWKGLDLLVWFDMFSETPPTVTLVLRTTEADKKLYSTHVRRSARRAGRWAAAR